MVLAELLDGREHVVHDELLADGLSEGVEAEQAGHAVQIVVVRGELDDSRQNHLHGPFGTELLRELLQNARGGFADSVH